METITELSMRSNVPVRTLLARAKVDGLSGPGGSARRVGKALFLTPKEAGGLLNPRPRGAAAHRRSVSV